MIPKNRKYLSIHSHLSIFAVPGIMKILAVLKKVLAVCRFFKPVNRNFHSYKEMEAFKTASNIKKNNCSGLGPPM